MQPTIESATSVPGHPVVSVIVVTHQSMGQIGACLDSLREHPPTWSHEVIVVDNHSTDGTVELLERRYPEVRLVRSRRRRGFAANCNDGAHLARGKTLVFLNPDTRVTRDSIDSLVQLLDTDPSVAIAGPRLVYPDGAPQPSARRFPTATTTLVRRTPLRWVLRNSKGEKHHLMLDRLGDAESREPFLVDWLLGAAMAVRAEVYSRLGGMDDRYRLYCEDIDLCWRAWEAGLAVVHVPQATVEHDLSELTRRRFFTRATIWHFGSMARFILSHGLRRPVAARAAV